MSNTTVTPGMAKSVSLGNRRAKIRYRCAPATMGKVLSTEDHEFQVVWILDLSQNGVGMQVARAIQPGRLILLTIRSNDGKKIFELPANVMHCKPVSHSEWSVGCEFRTPLSADDLEHLL